MATKSLPITATLKVKVPSQFAIPQLKDKKSVRKNVLQSISKLLRDEEMILTCFSYKSDDDFEQPVFINQEDCTFLTINIIESGNAVLDFNSRKTTILKRFRNELKVNREQILIDRTELIAGRKIRNIEVYMKSAVEEMRSRSSNVSYSFSRSLAYTG